MVQKELYSKNIVEAFSVVSEFIVKGAKGYPPHWPFPIIETNWYHSKFLPQEIIKIIKDLEAKGYNDKEMAKLFWGPSAITHWFYITEHALGTFGPVFEGLTVEGIEFIEKTIKFLNIQRKGDIFCRDWKNIILSQDEIKEVLNNKFLKTDLELTRILSKINTILWQYCILIQVGHRSYSQEFHGPYDLGDGKCLFVRDYFNLKPKEVWEFTSNLSFNKLRILEIYKDVEIEIDMFNHFRAIGSLPNNLQEFSVQIDDSFCSSTEEVQKLYESCLEILNSGNFYIKDFTKKDWVKKIIEMRYLLLKHPKEILGKDWKPPSGILALSEEVGEAEEACKRFIENMKKVIIGSPEDEAIKKLTQMFLECIYGI